MVELKGLSDHVGEIPKDQAEAQLQGVPLPKLSVPGLPFSVTPGVGNADFSFALSGDRISGKWSIVSNHAEWAADSASQASFGLVENTIWRVVSGLNQLTVNAELGGTISAPTLKVSSNLDNAIANQLRAIAGEELAKGEAKAKAAVDKIVADKVAPLQAKLDGAKGQAAQQLGLDRKQLDDAQKLLEAQLKRYTGGLRAASSCRNCELRFMRQDAPHGASRAPVDFPLPFYPRGRMRIGVPREVQPGEARVALVPESCKKLVQLGYEVAVETGAGVAAGFPDAAYRDSGAVPVGDAATLFGSADLLLKVTPPALTEPDEAAWLRPGSIYLGSLMPLRNLAAVRALAARKVTAFSTDAIPRTTRAQSMDTLSSMASIAGYKGVLLAASQLNRYFPMLTTAAGMVSPAKVFVIGAAVAGLQAIATARRLGANVLATDVRPEVKEQIESVGAKYVGIELKESAAAGGGYAKELSQEDRDRQRQLLADAVCPVGRGHHHGADRRASSRRSCSRPTWCNR